MSAAGRSARRRGFRRRDARAVYDLHFGPNMTPMVDVVLVILIFFMASAAFLGPELLLSAGLTRERAEPSTLEIVREGRNRAGIFELEAPTLFVRVRNDAGTLVFEGFGQSGLSLDAFRALAESVAAELRANGSLGVDPNRDTAVAIEVGSGIAYGDAVAIHDAVTAAGFTRVGLR